MDFEKIHGFDSRDVYPLSIRWDERPSKYLWSACFDPYKLRFSLAMVFMVVPVFHRSSRLENEYRLGLCEKLS